MCYITLLIVPKKGSPNVPAFQQKIELRDIRPNHLIRNPLTINKIGK